MIEPFGRRVGVALLSAAALVATPVIMPMGSASAHQRWRDVDGNNVSRVRHSGGGSFAESSPGRWTEFGAEGRPIHSFDETGRDAFTVTLVDRSRNATVILDLRSREIRGAGAFKQIRFLYSITDAEGGHRGGGRGDGRGDGWRDNDHRGDGRRDDDRRGGYGRGVSRDIEVGPIWNQSDAERKCRDKADQMRGEWTGQWHTTVQGRMSVCEIRFR